LTDTPFCRFLALNQRSAFASTSATIMSFGSHLDAWHLGDHFSVGGSGHFDLRLPMER
jgi:hypothetical protein